MQQLAPLLQTVHVEQLALLVQLKHGFTHRWTTVGVETITSQVILTEQVLCLVLVKKKALISLVVE